MPNHVTVCSKVGVSAVSGLHVAVNTLLEDVFLVGTLHLLHTISSSILTAILGYGGQETWVALVWDEVKRVPQMIMLKEFTVLCLNVKKTFC